MAFLLTSPPPRSLLRTFSARQPISLTLQAIHSSPCVTMSVIPCLPDLLFGRTGIIMKTAPLLLPIYFAFPPPSFAAKSHSPQSSASVHVTAKFHISSMQHFSPEFLEPASPSLPTPSTSLLQSSSGGTTGILAQPTGRCLGNIDGRLMVLINWSLTIALSDRTGSTNTTWSTMREPTTK